MQVLYTRSAKLKLRPKTDEKRLQNRSAMLINHSFNVSQASIRLITPMQAALAHLVLAVSVRDAARVFCLQLVVDRNVQVSAVLIVGTAAQLAADGLALLDSQDIGQIENSLFPVRVLRVWTGAETDGLVACGEFDIEPGDECMDVVGAADSHLVWQAEVQILGGAGVQIEGEYSAWVRDDCLELDGVDERLGEGGQLERSIVESVDVIPDFTASAVVSTHRSSSWTYIRSSHLCTLHPQYQP